MFGAGTAAYQHESAIHGTRDTAVWDVMGMRGPHLTADILKHMDDDIKLLKILKLNTYSFTIAWSRIFRFTSYNETAEPDLDALSLYRTYIQVRLD